MKSPPYWHLAKTTVMHNVLLRNSFFSNKTRFRNCQANSVILLCLIVRGGISRGVDIFLDFH